MMSEGREEVFLPQVQDLEDPTSLHTPQPLLQQLEWPSLGNLDEVPCGLFDEFNIKIEEKADVKQSLLTLEPPLDIGDLDYSLSVEDVDQILSDIHPQPIHVPDVSGPSLSDFPLQSQTNEEKFGVLVSIPDAQTVSHDHDYFDKQSEDWELFAEFLQDTQSCTTPSFNRQNSITPEGFDSIVSSTLQEFDSSLTQGCLDPHPSYMDTKVDLEPKLRAEKRMSAIRRGKTAEKDEKYWEKRLKNNVASQRSRAVRKNKRIQLRMEREELEERNAQLRAEVEKLESMTKEWKERLLTCLTK